MTMTPTQTVDAVYATLGRGEPQGILALLDPAVVWQGPPSVAWGGVHHGPAGARKFLETFGSLFELADLSRERTIAQDDMVVTCGTLKGKGRITGKAATSDYAWFWQVKNGKITRFQGYIDSATLAAATTPEPVRA